MTDAPPAAADAAAADPRVAEILAIFARETRIEPERLRLEARPDELGIASLDLTLAVFEIESRFGIDIPSFAFDPSSPAFTVGSLVDQVIAILDAAPSKRGADVRAPGT